MSNLVVKRLFSMLLTVVLMLTLVSGAWANSTVSEQDDLSGHWAETQMRKWAADSLLQGDGSGSYYPDQAIKRAELIAFINRAFHFTEKTDIPFADISLSHWAYDDIAIAVQAGYTNGYEDYTIRADQTITREEAAVMIARALTLDGDQTASEQLNVFSDADDISTWSKPYITALIDQQLIHGTPAGAIIPQGPLTRAEAITILDQAMVKLGEQTTLEQAGTYGPESGTQTILGNVAVTTTGITLRNTIITGDLILTDGIGEGEAFFNNVTVKGTTSIQGGGENSIHFEDSVLVRIVIDKRTGTVRVVAVGNSTIQSVIVSSPVTLEESHATDSGFKNVEISSALPAGSEVKLNGTFENVSVFSSDIKVSIPSGSVDQLHVDADTEGLEVEVNKEAKILELVLNAVAKILGEGTVEKAEIGNGAEGSSFENMPQEVSGDAADAIQSGNNNPANTGSNAGTNPGPTPNPGNAGDGDNDGDDDTNHPQPDVCQGTQAQCEDAHLAGLEVVGHDLHQLDANFNTQETTGFSPNVFAYNVVADSEQASYTVTVTKNVYSTVSITFFDTFGGYIKSETMTTENEDFIVTLESKEDTTLFINVNSGDNISVKQYKLIIQYPRTMQEAVKIDTRLFYQVVDGVTVTEATYFLDIGTIGGEKTRETDVVKVTQSGNPILDCIGSYCHIPTDKVVKSGTWDIEIWRGGMLWKEGEYHFNHGTVPMIQEDLGLTVVPKTKQELINDFVNSPGSSGTFKFGYRVFLNYAKLASVLPDAKYMNIDAEFMKGTVSAWPQGLSTESMKTNLRPYFYLGRHLPNSPREITSDLSPEHSFWGANYLLNENDPNNLVEDAFVRFSFYDEQMNVIGQTIVVLAFDENHVAEGYTPAKNWQPS